MKVLFICSQPMAQRMGGPAIRYWELSHALAERHEVTLAAPSFERTSDRVRLVAAPPAGRLGTLRGHDVAVVHDPRPALLARLRRTGCLVVYDAYDPVVLENLLVARDFRLQDAVLSATAAQTRIALLSADAVICASERQRDYYLGALAALGRIETDVAQDVSLRSLVDVVPFGVAPGRPSAAAVPPRSALGWESDDVVALWGGGLWDWLDGETVVRGLALASRQEPRLRLLFLGTQRPGGADAGGFRAIEAARSAAAQTGVVDSGHVVFRDGWVPYDERQGFLVDADIGVSAHRSHVETRFAFRTRVLDYLWAGLPCVLTAGDVLADLAVERGFGRTPDEGDVEGWRDALLELSDEATRSALGTAAADTAEDFRWPRIAAQIDSVLTRIGRREERLGPGLATGYADYVRHALTWSRLDGRLARIPGLRA